MNLNELDNKNGAPIHWASYLGYENSVNILCAWGV